MLTVAYQVRGVVLANVDRVQGIDPIDRGPCHAMGRHLICPFCDSYDVSRMFLASLRLDSCECAACGGRWDEENGTGEYRGRAQQSSVVIRRID
jgi:hypothetical protein